MLEQAVILECHSTNSSKDGTLHEMIRVRAEAIDNVVVIPDIDLRDLPVRSFERFVAVPTNVIGIVVPITLSSHFSIEIMVAPFMRVRDFRPSLQRTIHTDAVVVDLVATTYHDMERFLRVHS